MERDLAGSGISLAEEPGCCIYTWVDKWKGFKRGQAIPPVDIIGAQKFQTGGGDAHDRFETDVVDNDGNPMFLRNQLLQKWVVPYWKKESGFAMAWCCICGSEAWTPVHFYSNKHLKGCILNPKTWEATWKCPTKYHTCVEDFHAGPEGSSPEDLMALQDCPEAMMNWAGENLKLSKKPGSGEAASSNGRNLDVRREDQLVSEILEEADRRLAEQVFELATQIDLQTQQIWIQADFISLLESRICDYHKMMMEKGQIVDSHTCKWSEWSSKQTEEKQKVWHKIGLLEEALEEAKNQNKDNMRQMIPDLETKHEKSKTSGCFSGIMNWCR